MRKPTEAVGINIRRMRQRQGYSLLQIAALAGIRTSTMGLLERGGMRWNTDNLLRVQIVLGLPISHLWPYRIGKPERVCEETLRDAVTSAQLPWAPTIQWVIDRTAEVCGVPLEDMNRHRTTDPKVLNARTVAGLVVQDIEGLTLSKLAQALNRDVATLSHNCTEARFLEMRRTQEPVQRIKERLQRAYGRFNPDL